MIELYHSDFSTCSQKVRLVLAEKGLEWESHHLDLMAGDHHKPDYVKLNPNKVAPTLVHDGRAIIESSLIAEYLDRIFEPGSLSPDDPYDFYKMQLWTKRIDEKIHWTTGTLMTGIGARPMLLKKSPEEREAIYASLAKKIREIRRSVVEEGFESPYLQTAVQDSVALLDDMEQTLTNSLWLAGDSFSLADIGLVINVQRYADLQLSPLFSADSRPRVADWLERVKARTSWQEAVENWVPEPRREMLKQCGQAAWPKIEPMVA